MMDLAKDLFLLFFPIFLSFLVSRFSLPFLKGKRYEKLLHLAEDAVRFAEDAFPGSEGTEKLKKAVEYLQTLALELGFRLENQEAEEKIRIAFQRVQKEALARILERALKGK